MIDNLFGMIEDIYFTINTDTKQDNDQLQISPVDISSTFGQVIAEFKEKASLTVYVGKSGMQYLLLKLSTIILNHLMYEDDGNFSSYEEILIREFIGTKLTRLSPTEQDDLLMVFQLRYSLKQILSFINEHEISLRAIDMLLDKIVKHIEPHSQYQAPLMQLYEQLNQI